MKLLVIGGTGVISTPITRLLVERGDHVTLFNRGQTSSPLAQHIRVIAGDRREHARFAERVSALGTFDCVVDMFSFTAADAESSIRALSGRTAQYIFCSTVDVYQKPAHRLPYREDEPYGGLNAYAWGKIDCERAFVDAHARGDFAVTVLRPAYTYGEGRGLLYPIGSAGNYLQRIRAGQPILVPGDGNSLWVACHAEDVARAFVNAIGQPLSLGRAYHVTGDEWMTWNEYHQGVAAAIGAPAPELVHVPTDALASVAPDRAASVLDNFQFNNVFDNRAAQTDLGFRYTIPWRAGVERTVAWLDRQPPPVVSDATIDDQIVSAWREAQTVFSRRMSEG